MSTESQTENQTASRSDTQIDTHCPYCALQCATSLTPVDTAERVTVAGREFPTNRGGLCQKGWTAATLLNPSIRLTTPLVRDSRDEPLRPTTWDDALDRVACAIRSAQAHDGPDAVAVFGGGGLTNEKAYTLGKFARVVLGTSQIDYNGRFCMSSAAAAGMRAFGIDRGLPFPITDIAEADAVLLLGGNVAETMPPFMQHLAAVRERGGTVIVADPRETATVRAADVHLQLTPGTDLVLALGLLHIALVEGLVDHDYIAARTTGWESVRAEVAQWWPERVEAITGVSMTTMRTTVHRLAGAKAAIVLTARGAEQHSTGTDTVSAIINLALALGLPGRPGSGYGCLTGQGNGQGGREHGQKADQLPGYRRIDDPAARAHVAAVWGVDPDSLPGPGKSAYELLDSLGDGHGPRVLLVHASNVAVSAPNAGHVQRKLSALDFLVVSDVVVSETAELADVVLPVTQWAEEDGTLTNLEGRVLRRRRAIDPEPGVRSDLEVLSALADLLDKPSLISADPGTVYAELQAASAGGPADYSGISLSRLDNGEALYWPCPATPVGETEHPGTPRMFTEAFNTPDGRAKFVPVTAQPTAEMTDSDYPLILTTGRVLQHYQSGAQTRRVPELNAAVSENYVEIHPEAATALSIEEGQRVDVVSRRGHATARVRLSTRIRRDTVFMPFHFAGHGRSNLVTSAALDPTSRMPAFKFAAVRVELAVEAPTKKHDRAAPHEIERAVA